MRALESFDEALRLKPDFTNALIAKGIILGKMGRKEEAKICADKVLKVKNEAGEEESVQTSTNDSIKQGYDAAQKKFRQAFSPDS